MPRDLLLEWVDTVDRRIAELRNLVFGTDEHLARWFRIDEAQLSPDREGEDDMRVRLDTARRAGLRKLAGVAQVDDHQVAVVQVEEQVLSGTIDLLELRLFQECLKLLAPAVARDDLHRVACGA